MDLQEGTGMVFRILIWAPNLFGLSPSYTSRIQNLRCFFNRPIPEREPMGWSHPDISLEELIRHVKGFVDILILASGYQSSGLPATWDAQNIKKALKWGIFFQDVFKRLRDCVDYEDSMKDLDSALFDLTSNLFFPQGLGPMSSSTLSRARNLILEHFLRSHPFRDAHMVALLTAVIEMDIEDLAETDFGSANAYFDKLMFQIESLNLIPAGNSFVMDSSTSSLAMDPGTPLGKYRVCNPRSPVPSYVKSKDFPFVGNSCFILQELLKRQATVSLLSSLEAGLDTLLNVFARNHMVGSGSNSLEGQQSNRSLPKNEEILSELFLWNQWRSKCLSYMLNKRTIRLLSGANLIFSAPKPQYVRVLESLTASIDAKKDNFLETMEISLLGFISNRWSFLMEYFMSQSFDFFSISKLYSNLHHLLQGNPQSFHSEIETLNVKEKDILEYVTPLLVSHPCILWQLPPILVAAIPSWSILFRMYVSEIERQFNGALSSIRCCECSQVGKEHGDCEVAERIRCLYIFHPDSYPMVNDCSA